MEADGDGLSFMRPAPNTDWPIALKHRVVGKEIRQLHRCCSSQRKGNGKDRRQQQQADQAHGISGQKTGGSDNV
jgi:hypothetical protein